MKMYLIILALASFTVHAADKKKVPETDMREGTKAVDEKYLDDLSGTNIPEHKPVSSAADRTHQMESKKSRQYQEEDVGGALKKQN
jgi:hypothetical protein